MEQPPSEENPEEQPENPEDSGKSENQEQPKSQEQSISPEKIAFTESVMIAALARGYSLVSENEKEKVFEKDGQTMTLIYNFNPSHYISGIARFEYEGQKPGTITFDHKKEINDTAVENTFDALLNKYETRYEQDKDDAPYIRESTGERLSAKEVMYVRIKSDIDSARERMDKGEQLDETLASLYDTGEQAYQAYEDGLCNEIKALMTAIEGKMHELRISKLKELGYEIVSGEGKVLWIKKGGYSTMMEVGYEPSKYGHQGGKITSFDLSNTEGMRFHLDESYEENSPHHQSWEGSYLKIVQELIDTLN